MTGVRFHFPIDLGISLGDRLEVKFIIDAPQKTTVCKEVEKFNSTNGQYGREFLNLAIE